MIQADIDSVLEIDRVCHVDPWTKKTLKEHLRRRECIGMVFESEDEQILGYAVYETAKTSITVLRLAVRWSMHRRGVGTAIVNHIVSRLTQRTRSRISITVPETNLECQLFLRSLDFKAVRVVRNVYDSHVGPDAYEFLYVLPKTADVNG
jgi:ribosomal-protein-alanine N-acetyltransferase